MTSLHIVVEAVGAQLPELSARALAGGPRAADIGDFIDFAERAEQARVDALFYADFMGKPRQQFARRPLIPFEPFTALAAVATHTTRIGLVATASTTFAEPYSIARQVASLDNLSEGRAGWNIVTSIQGAGNYGLDALPGKGDRYARAAEVTDAVLDLWSSWGRGYLYGGDGFVDTGVIDQVRRNGKFVSLDGWLDLPSDAQTRPVLFQAGSSAAGLDFAARYAEVVFGINSSKAGARRTRERLRALAAANGRSPEDVAYLPGVRLFVDENIEVVDTPSVRAQLSSVLGVPLEGLDPDAPLPESLLAERSAVDTQAALITGTTEGLWDLASEPGTTLRDLLRAYGAGSGFLVLDGPADSIVNTLQGWVDDGAADGFVIGAGGDIDAVYSQVIPRLRAAGRFRSDYEGTTLRAHLKGTK